MNTDTISAKQGISAIAMFILGSSLVLGVRSNLGEDTWIGLFTSVIIVVPFLLIYGRILKLYPGKNIFEILEIVFGKFIGKIFILLMSWYAIHLGALVLNNFTEFTNISLLKYTPKLVISICMISVATYLAKSGVKAIGKWSTVVLMIVGSLIIFTLVSGFDLFKVENLLPIFDNSVGAYAKTSYDIFAFPFAETVLFTAILSSLRKQENTYKVYLIGAGIGLIFLSLVVIRNIAFLGLPLLKASAFPSVTATRLITIAKIFSSVEGFIVINFIFAGITKLTICLFVGAKGLSKLFEMRDYNSVFLPTSLLIITLSKTLYRNVFEMFSFIEIYAVYAAPFQVIIPIIIWIAAEIKTKVEKKRLNLSQPKIIL